MLLEAGVPVVPTLARIPYNFDEAVKLAEGLTLTRGATSGTIREGVVIEPIKVRYDARLGRVKQKIVSGEYLTLYRGS